MRTHRTVYRVLNADGTEAYRGKRSAVVRFCESKRRAASGVVKSYRVQHGSYDPLLERGPSVWVDDGPADKFRTRSNP